MAPSGRNSRQVHPWPSPDAPNLPDHVNQPTNSLGRCCWSIILLVFLVLVLVYHASFIFDLVISSRPAEYSVDNVAIRGLNLTSSSAISPEFDVTFRAHNPSHKIGIFYEKGGVVKVYYFGFCLGNGVLPAFYQPSKNLTVFETVLKSSGVVLTSAIKSEMEADSNAGFVELMLKIKVPVKIKVKIGSHHKTEKWTAKGECYVILDNFSPNSKIISNFCEYI